MSIPKISIITPSYNQGPFLEEALLSVKSQEYPNIEHIVMDGGSKDDTVDILKSFSRKPGWEHLRWVSEPDKGQSDALNKGFRAATGDIIGWLNSDDRYRPGCFKKVLDSSQRWPAADVLYGDYTFIDTKGEVQKIRREIDFSPFVLQYHRVLYIPTTSTFFKRRIFDESNWIDISLHYAMDYEFFQRLAGKGYVFRHIPELLADFRLHPASKTGAQADRQLKEHDEIAIRYSRILSRTTGVSRQITFKLLRTAAGGLRYGEKFLRGYYFQTPSRLGEN